MSKPTSVFEIPVELIDPNPQQPRSQFDQAKLDELAQSIRENGVIQALVVEQVLDTGRYILHAGERRLRAAKLAGLQTVPCILKETLSDRERLVMALVENVQREDMSPLDVARACARLHDEMGLTDQQIADKMGKSRSSVANARRLLELPADIQDLANVEGVSERQIAALLPLYQQPKIVKAAEKKGWLQPSHLVEDIRTGKLPNSDSIRSRVTQIVRQHTEDLSQANFPLDHAFDGVKVKSPTCDACPLRVKSGSEWRCPDKNCFDRKAETWRADQLRRASDASGIPVGDLASNRHGQVGYFYGEGGLLRQIVADRCPNLRLEWDVYGSVSEPIPGFPNVKVVCHHDEGKHCTCLSKLKAERTRTDPLHIAEREREKEMQRLLDTYGALVAAALVAGNTHVWLRILRIVDYQIKKGDALTLDQIRQRIARNLVNNSVSWKGKNDVEIARNEMRDLLAEFGIETPEGDPSDPAADLKRRFARIQGWIADLDPDGVTLEAVDGNLANLDKLTAEFDALAEQHIDNPEFDGFLLAIAEAWDTLTELRRQIQANAVGAQTPEVTHG